MKFWDFVRAKRKPRSAPPTTELAIGAGNLPQLPSNIVETIVGFISQQIETSAVESDSHHCHACALRDLSRCTLIDRTWHQKANRLLYATVDLDATHSCGQSYAVTKRPKRKLKCTTQWPSMRLQLFLRTIDENKLLGTLVIVLKAACIRDHLSLTNLARLVPSLPRLREIDLSSSFYKGASSTLVLRQELETNCPDIRSTIYCSGAGLHFNNLAQRNCWPRLNRLELSDLDTDVFKLRKILGSMSELRTVKLSQMKLGDGLFRQTQGLPSLPPFEELHIEDDSAVTSAGLLIYLSYTPVATSLRNLSVIRTGVTAMDLHTILTIAINLECMALTQEINCSLHMQQHCSGTLGAVQDIPKMASESLRDLTFDISPSRNSTWTDAQSYYEYLLPSVQGNLFPDLRKLFVLDADFVNKLLHLPSFSSCNPFIQSRIRLREQPLEVYIKGSSELPWSSATLATYYTSSMSNPIDRPVDASDIPGRGGTLWTGEARKSVLLPNGFGNFFVIPQAPADTNADMPWKSLEPSDACVATGRLEVLDRRVRRSRIDLWR